MTGRERLRRLLRPVGQATMYFVFLVAIAEFLRRGNVVTHAIFTPATIVCAGVLWLGLVAFRIYSERKAS